LILAVLGVRASSFLASSNTCMGDTLSVSCMSWRFRVSAIN
jgi:hypothetical protein